MTPTFYTYCHARADNGHVFYIGKGKGRRAWVTHNRNKHWANIANKHGHRVHILAEFAEEAEAFKHERELIEVARLAGLPLCNLTDGGDGTSGWHHSAETKLKIRNSNIGQVRPPVTDEYRAKQSAIATGRVKSPETCARLKASLKGNGLGKIISEETRAKTSATMKGRTFSEEHKANLRAAQLAKPSLGMQGKKHSPETIARMRASALLRKSKRQAGQA